MVKKLFKAWHVKTWLLLCAAFLLGVPASAQSAASLPAMDADAQDASGTVWATPWDNNGYDHTYDGKIYRRQAAGWAAQAIPGAAGFHHRALARGDDGSVYVLWQNSDWQNGVQQPSQCLITVHRGIGSHLLVRFASPFPPDTPFPGQRLLWAGNGGDVWIADAQSTLRHVTAEGAVQSFALTPEQCFGGKAMPGFPGGSFHSLTDGRGRRWFWQSSLDTWMPGTLRGVLIWDGKTLTYHAKLSGVPDQSYNVLAPLDQDHFWLATSGNDFAHWPVPPGALYQVDTRTLSAVRVAPPSKEAFGSIVRIFRIKGDPCVLEGNVTNPLPARLWRRHGTAWHREPQALADSQYGYLDRMPQAFLETPQGTWLAVNGAGLYWLPTGGSPAVRVDWRRGFPLGQVSSLFRLPDGQIMASAGLGGSFVFPPHPHPLYPARLEVAVGASAVPATLSDMVADPRRHLWGLGYLANSRRVLTEWDGKHWHTYPIPKNILGVKNLSVNSLSVNSLSACDIRGRLWLATSYWNPPAQPQPINGIAIYDPAHRTWANYATLPEAVQAAASLPAVAFLPKRADDELPRFSGDGRAAFVRDYTLFLYNGHFWQHWKTREVKPGANNVNFESAPRFSPLGRLEINLDNQNWEWTSDGGWRLDGPARPAPTSPPLPPGGPKGFWGTPITDSQGGQWVVWSGDIYLARHGLWTKQTALSGPGSPFGDGRGLSDVLQDPNGHDFFLTNPGGYYEYVVWSPPAATLPPTPRVQLTPLPGDSVRLRFATKLSGPHWFQWRLNGGEWGAPQKTTTVLLSALPCGTYRVEAQTIDARLQASTKPALAVFVIKPASAAQIARWVRALLSGSEDDREAAVAGLVKQPDDALPALDAARPGASEAARWWLDAAVQQIADRKHGAETAGE